MSKWKQFLMVLGLVVGVGAAALPATPVGAINVFSGCTGQATDAQSVCGNTSSDKATSMVKTIVNTLLFILGIIAVIVIIIGGIRYTVSSGNSSEITAAKNTIMYAVIGLVVAILAYAIVNFVITSFK